MACKHNKSVHWKLKQAAVNVEHKHNTVNMLDNNLIANFFTCIKQKTTDRHFKLNIHPDKKHRIA